MDAHGRAVPAYGANVGLDKLGSVGCASKTLPASFFLVSESLLFPSKKQAIKHWLYGLSWRRYVRWNRWLLKSIQALSWVIIPIPASSLTESTKAGRTAMLASTLGLGLSCLSLYTCSLFYIFSTLWSKNAVLRLKIHFRFSAITVGIKEFLSSQNPLCSPKFHLFTWLKSCRAIALKPLVCLPFWSLDNGCLHLFYTLFWQSIRFKIGVEWGIRGP